MKYTWKATGASWGWGAVAYADLMAVMPHMHGRGKAMELRLAPDPAPPCPARPESALGLPLAKVYFYRTRPRRTPRSQIEVTCDYDTSQDRVPVLPGWGTKNEMCLTVLMVALPPQN